MSSLTRKVPVNVETMPPHGKARPLVSVVTPSYNQGIFIGETIGSVRSQDYPAIEHIVIDGGSTDGTVEILRECGDGLDWVSEPDSGQSDAINKGFRRSRGEIVAWLNSDDTYCPGAVSAAVEYLDGHPDVAMVYGEGFEMDEQGRPLGRFGATQPFDLWKLIHVWDYILQPTVFMRREALFDAGLLDGSLHWCMDWDLWIRLGTRGPVGYIPAPLANSRVYGETKTSSGGLKRFREIVSVMRRHGGMRYPPGFFVYGQDTLERVVQTRFPRAFRLGLKYPLYALRHLAAGMIEGSQGVYRDGWVGREAKFLLPRLGREVLEIRGKVPAVPGLIPLRVDVDIDGKRSCSTEIPEEGPFAVRCSLGRPSGNLLAVTVRSDRWFRPSRRGGSTDRRTLSFVMEEIGLRDA